jgi:hypothetical protein
MHVREDSDPHDRMLRALAGRMPGRHVLRRTDLHDDFGRGGPARTSSHQTPETHRSTPDTHELDGLSARGSVTAPPVARNRI